MHENGLPVNTKKDRKEQKRADKRNAGKKKLKKQEKEKEEEPNSQNTTPIKDGSASSQSTKEKSGD
jgi:hypothetical protein